MDLTEAEDIKKQWKEYTEELCKKAKWLSGEALQIAVKRREVKNQGEKERYKHLNAEFQRIARRDKKAFFSDQCKEIHEKNKMGKTRDLFKKIRVTKGRQWHPTPVLLPGKSTCLENPMDGEAWWAAVHGIARSRTRRERLHFDFSLSCIGEGNGNPLQCSCLENPRDRGALWAAVYGVAQSRT